VTFRGAFGSLNLRESSLTRYQVHSLALRAGIGAAGGFS